MASCLASLTAAFCAESDCGPATSLAHSWETLRASTGSSGLRGILSTAAEGRGRRGGALTADDFYVWLISSRTR